MIHQPLTKTPNTKRTLRLIYPDHLTHTDHNPTQVRNLSPLLNPRASPKYVATLGHSLVGGVRERHMIRRQDAIHAHPRHSPIILPIHLQGGNVASHHAHHIPLRVINRQPPTNWFSQRSPWCLKGRIGSHSRILSPPALSPSTNIKTPPPQRLDSIHTASQNRFSRNALL